MFYLTVLSVQYLKSFDVLHADTFHPVLFEIEFDKFRNGPRRICKLDWCWLKSIKNKPPHTRTTLQFSLLTQELLMVLALREDCLLSGVGIVMPAARVVVS